MARKQLIIGLDFETYFDKDYTLRKMSTSEYIRDERFKTQCVGIKTSRQKKARWYPAGDVEAALNQFDWANSALLCHHTQFDGLILSHHYGIIPAYNYCTLSMARPLHGGDIPNNLDALARFYGLGNKVPNVLDQTKGIRDLSPELMTQLGIYCGQDVNLMWLIFKLIKDKYPQSELDLIDHTVRMFTDPVLKVDVPRAEAELKREVTRKRRLINSAGKHIGIKGYDKIIKVLASSDKFANALHDKGVKPPVKRNPKGKFIYAFAKTDIEFQRLGMHDYESIRTLVKARIAAKSTIGEAKAERLLDHGRPPYNLPIYLNYGKAHTLRWTGGDKMNPQNFVRGGELRRSILAPKGYNIIVVDSAQIEARYNGWFCGQKELLKAFADPHRDPYKEMASIIYDKPVSTIISKERFVGKVAVLGLGYQMGAPKFRLTLETGAMGPPVKITDQQAAKAVAQYRKANNKIAIMWKTMQSMLHVMVSDKRVEFGCLTFRKNGIDLPNGMTLEYPHLRSQFNDAGETSVSFVYGSHTKPKKIYGGLLLENIIQCLARIAVGEQMLEIGKVYRLVLMTHDESGYLATIKESEAALAFGIKCFRKPPIWCPDIPLDAEGGFDTCYSK